MSGPGRIRIVLVTGLSGGGKASILRALEDVGYEAVDNQPFPMLEEMVSRSDQKLAVGVDARTRGFDAQLVLEALDRLRANPRLLPELVYAMADDTTLLLRYTETRRRHPLAPEGRVSDGIAAERELTRPLREAADLVLDTSDLPLASLRRLIERHFGPASEGAATRLVVSLMSFAYSHGLPRDADVVFDARFLRNPHYDTILRPRTGLDPEVGLYVETDPDFREFFGKITGLVDLLLPRFVQEGKKYATITIGCTGGRHRSVYLVEKLAAHLQDRIAAECARDGHSSGWRLHVTHRELAREGHEAAYLTDRPIESTDQPAGAHVRPDPVQAQEA